MAMAENVTCLHKWAFLPLEKLFMRTRVFLWVSELASGFMIMFCLHSAFEGSCLLITAVVKVLAKFHFTMVSVFQAILQNKLFWKISFVGSDGYLFSPTAYIFLNIPSSYFFSLLSKKTMRKLVTCDRSSNL